KTIFLLATLPLEYRPRNESIHTDLQIARAIFLERLGSHEDVPLFCGIYQFVQGWRKQMLLKEIKASKSVATGQYCNSRKPVLQQTWRHGLSRSWSIRKKPESLQHLPRLLPLTAACSSPCSDERSVFLPWF